MSTIHNAFSGPSAGSVQLGANSGRIGDIHIYNSAPSRRPSPPARSLLPVPFHRDRDFIDRGDLLERIRERCSQPVGRVALAGLGGVGKSQLAIEYAHRVLEQSPQPWVFWIHASTTARVEEAYRAIAERLGLITADNRQGNALELLQRWLEKEENGKWVMVVDNADDIGVFFNTEPSETKPLASYLPQSHHGRIVFTSRNDELASRLAGSRNIIKVGPMENEEGMALFQKKLVNQDNDKEAAELLRVLDNIPLAISQAAAYINRPGPRRSARGYLETYHRNKQSRTSLLKYDGGDLRRDTSAHNSVIVTWQISFEQIEKERRSAADLLSLMSFFNWQGIPRDFLREAARSWPIQQDQDPDFEFDEDVVHLSSYSLVTTRSAAEGDMFDMHRLVHMSTRTWLSAKEQSRYWEQVFLQTMAHSMPTAHFENWSRCQTMFPHAEAAGTTKPYDVALWRDWAEMIYKAGWYALEMGQYAVAEDMVRKSAEARERVLTAEHAETLDSLSLLALVLRYNGKYETAEDMNRRVLEGYEKTLGKEHHDTLISVGDLAVVLYDLGKYEAAEEMSLRALEGYEKLLGKEHYNTLSTVGNLALVLQDLGKYEEVEEMSLRVVEGMEKVLGKEHPDTLIAVSNLGVVLQALGKYEAAEEMHLRVLEGSEKLLGKEHPETLKTVGILAELKEEQQDFTLARRLYERAVSGLIERLGRDHKSTKDCLRRYNALIVRIRKT